MRFLCLACLLALLGCTADRAAQPSATSVHSAVAEAARAAERDAEFVSADAGPDKLNVVAGLALTDPQTVTTPGWAEVAAKVDAKDGAKVELRWRVKATFERDVKFRWKLTDGDRVMLVTVPDAKGVVEVTCVACIDGKMTDFCETAVEVAYQAGPPPAVVPNAPKAAKAPAAEGKAVTCYLCYSFTDADPDVAALMRSTGTKNRLRGAGLTAETLDANGANVRKIGLDVAAKEAGVTGAFAAFVTGERRVKKIVAVSKSTTIDDLLRAAAE